MASPIRVKVEASLGDTHVSTDTSEDEAEKEDISLEELQLLDSKFEAQSKFPPGCRVWYHGKKSRASSELRAKSASVANVYIHIDRMQKVYKVEADTQIKHDIFLYEGQLMYGMYCPVIVTDVNTNETRDGVIICPNVNKCVHGKQRYVVQYSKGSDNEIEFDIADECINYRVVMTLKGGDSEEKATEMKILDETKKNNNEEEVSTHTNNEDVKVSRQEKNDINTTASSAKANAASDPREAPISTGTGKSTQNKCTKLADTVANNNSTPCARKTMTGHSVTPTSVDNEQKRVQSEGRCNEKLSTSRWKPHSPSFQRKRTAEFDANDRPPKTRMNKYENDRYVKKTLNIPQALTMLRNERADLFRKLL